MRTEYHDSALVRADGPFMGNLVKAEGALCPDGKRRNAFPTYDGLADTFFSIPAFVYVRRTRVYGYVTTSTMSGSSVETDDDPTTVRFVPYAYRKNHRLVERPEGRCPDDGTCHHLCESSCYRVFCCGPLSGVFPGDEWPADVVAANPDTGRWVA